jgi:hypothetical protein
VSGGLRDGERGILDLVAVLFDLVNRKGTCVVFVKFMHILLITRAFVLRVLMLLF